MRDRYNRTIATLVNAKGAAGMSEQFGKYQILNKIATGGMAEVFKAIITGEKGFEKLVVIKKVLPHLADEDKWIMHFTDEAKLAALLQHENIVHVYDSGKIDDTWYIAMEYLDGMDLKSVMVSGLKQEKPLDTGLVLHIMKGICEGLDYAHALTDYQGKPLDIIHRDISPQNIFITFDGKVKIIDFGIAKAAERSVKTQTGTIKGKLAYMAPEHAEGKPIDHRSDIFSAGILFYEMLTGKKMYPGEMADILMKVVRAEFTPVSDLISDCPTGIVDILDKALTQSPDARYETAGDMASEIEDCLYDLGIKAGARHLAAYMKDLFPDESEKGLEALTTLDLTRNETPAHEKTRALSPETEEMPGKIKASVQPFKEAFSKEKIAEKTKAVKQVIAKRKTTTLTAVFILVIAIGVTGTVIYLGKTHARIDALLETAHQRFDVLSLTEPPEDSAAYYFGKVLEIDDDNEDAGQGIRDIVAKKIELAEMLMKRFRKQAALAEIDSGLALDPENERLLELKKEAEKNVGQRVIGGFKSLFKSDGDSAEETTEEPENQ